MTNYQRMDMSLIVLARHFKEHNWNHRRITDLGICLHLTEKGNITDRKQFLESFYIKRLIWNSFTLKEKAALEQISTFCKVCTTSAKTNNLLIRLKLQVCLFVCFNCAHKVSTLDETLSSFLFDFLETVLVTLFQLSF